MRRHEGGSIALVVLAVVVVAAVLGLHVARLGAAAVGRARAQTAADAAALAAADMLALGRGPEVAARAAAETAAANGARLERCMCLSPRVSVVVAAESPTFGGVGGRLQAQASAEVGPGGRTSTAERVE